MMKMMNISPWLLIAFFAASLISLGPTGCSSDDPSSSQQNFATMEDQEDISDDYGATLADPDEGMLYYWRSQDTASPDGISLNGEKGKSLDDTVIYDYNGFTVVKVRNFFDEDGHWSLTFDSLLTVRMDQYLSIDGTHTNQSGRRTVTVDHDDTLHVVGLGLASDRLTLDDNGRRMVESEFTSRFSQNIKTTTANYVWVANDVVFLKNFVLNPYPLSGNVRVSVDWTRTHDNPGGEHPPQSVHVSFTIIFDGTQYAEMIMDSGTHFWIDLSNGWPYRNRPHNQG